MSIIKYIQKKFIMIILFRYILFLCTSCEMKSWYDYLQLKAAEVIFFLSYTILKKVLPKGTVSLFKRSIASQVFYSNNQKEFDTDLEKQFLQFKSYCKCKRCVIVISKICALLIYVKSVVIFAH